MVLGTLNFTLWGTQSYSVQLRQLFWCDPPLSQKVIINFHKVIRVFKAGGSPFPRAEAFMWLHGLVFVSPHMLLLLLSAWQGHLCSGSWGCFCSELLLPVLGERGAPEPGRQKLRSLLGAVLMSPESRDITPALSAAVECWVLFRSGTCGWCPAEPGWVCFCPSQHRTEPAAASPGALQPTWSASHMGYCTKHFAVTEALLASVTWANHWLSDCYMRFWECLREKSCSLQNYSPCWGKTVTDCQEVFTQAKKLGSAWVPRAWQVSQTKFEYVDCDSD